MTFAVVVGFVIWVCLVYATVRVVRGIGYEQSTPPPRGPYDWMRDE